MVSYNEKDSNNLKNFKDEINISDNVNNKTTTNEEKHDEGTEKNKVTTKETNKKLTESKNSTVESIEKIDQNDVNSRVILAYATQTGQSKSIAGDLAALALNNGIDVKPVCFSELFKNKEFDLSKEHLMLWVASTTGDGDPSDTATRFWRALKKNKTQLTTLKFTVLGLGDTNYTNFCNFGKNLNRRLLEMGATHWLEPKWADDAIGTELAAEEWIEDVVDKLVKENFGKIKNVNSIEKNNEIINLIEGDSNIKDGKSISIIENLNFEGDTVKQTREEIENLVLEDKIEVNSVKQDIENINGDSALSKEIQLKVSNTDDFKSLIKLSSDGQNKALVDETNHDVLSSQTKTTSATVPLVTESLNCVEISTPQPTPHQQTFSHHIEQSSSNILPTNAQISVVQLEIPPQFHFSDFSVPLFSNVSLSIPPCQPRFIEIILPFSSSCSKNTDQSNDNGDSLHSKSHQKNYQQQYSSTDSKFQTYPNFYNYINHTTENKQNYLAQTNLDVENTSSQQPDISLNPIVYHFTGDARSEFLLSTVTSLKNLTNNHPGVKKVFKLDMNINNQHKCRSIGPGDTLGIIVPNHPSEIDTLIKRLGFSDNEIALKTKFEVVNNVLYVKKKAVSCNGLSVTDICTWLLDLRSAIKKAFIRSLLEVTTDPIEKRLLEVLCSKQGSQFYSLLCLDKGWNILELLKSLPSCRPSLSLLYEHLPKIPPRVYSICNLPHNESNDLSIVFSLSQYDSYEFTNCDSIDTSETNKSEDFKTNIGTSVDVNSDKSHNKTKVLMKPVIKDGLCTGWFSSYMGDEERIELDLKICTYLRPPTSFQPPHSLFTPFIMVAPGTGVAPFIGFLEYRESMMKAGMQVSPAWLFFGCRNRNDFIFKDLMEEFLENRVLTKLVVCFSRLSTTSNLPQNNKEHNVTKESQKVEIQDCLPPKCADNNFQRKEEMSGYVQDGMIMHGKEVYRLVLEEHANVYICGDAVRMSVEVDKALKTVFEKYGYLNGDEVSEMVKQLRKNKRIVEDVWV